MHSNIKMLRSLNVLTVIVLWIHIKFSFSITYDCSDTKPPNGIPLLPQPKFSDEFQAVVSVYDQVESVKMYANLYYSLASQKAAIEYRKFKDLPNKAEKQIFDFEMHQILHIKDNACTVKKIDYRNNILSQLMTIKQSDGSFRMKSSEELFLLSDQTKQTYNVYGFALNGISVEKLVICVLNTDFNGSFHNAYYFSKRSLGTENSQLVQVDVNGDISGTNQTRFMHTFYVTDFIHKITDRISAFETKPDIFCDGVKSNKSKPIIGDEFYYTTENIELFHDNNIADNNVIYYSKENRLIRRDYRSTFLSQPLANITDYNRGLIYVINKETGDCTRKQFKMASSNTDLFPPPSKFFLNMDKASYQGQEYVRQMLCDRWAALEEDGTVKTIYFASTKWWDRRVDLSKHSKKYSQFPVKMKYKKTDRDYTSYMLNFVYGPVDLSAFSLTACFHQRHITTFTLTFAANYTRDVSLALERQARDVIVNVTGVEKFQIQKLSSDFDSNYIYLTASILDPVPPAASMMFTSVPGSFIYQDGLPRRVTSVDDCASVCISFRRYRCISFDYCPYSKHCSISDHYRNSTTPKTTSEVLCRHYWRSVNETKTHVPLHVAFEKIESAVTAGHLKFYLKASNEVLNAVRIKLNYGYFSTFHLRPPASNIKFQVETYDSRSKQLDYQQTWYLKDFNVERVDNTQMDASTKTMQKFSTIIDYNTGVKYVRNHDTGHCSIDPLVSTSAVYINKLAEIGRDLFFYDVSLKWFGQKTYNDFLVDMYEGQRTDQSGILRTYHVFVPQSRSNSALKSSQDLGDVPVAAHVITPKINFQVLRYFKVEKVDDTHDIHLDPCFAPSQMKLLKIYFSGQLSNSQEAVFLTKVRVTILGLLKLNPARLVNEQLNILTKGIWYTADLIENPPALDRFLVAKFAKMTPTIFTIKATASNPQQCANMCLRRMAVCISFDYSETGRCEMSNQTLLARHLQNHRDFTHYTRIVSPSRYSEETVDECVQKLKDLMANMEFTLYSKDKTSDFQVKTVNAFNLLRTPGYPQIFGYGKIHSCANHTCVCKLADKMPLIAIGAGALLSGIFITLTIMLIVVGKVKRKWSKDEDDEDNDERRKAWVDLIRQQSVASASSRINLTPMS